MLTIGYRVLRRLDSVMAGRKHDASENLDPWLHDPGRLCRRNPDDRDGAIQIWLPGAVEVMLKWLPPIKSRISIARLCVSSHEKRGKTGGLIAQERPGRRQVAFIIPTDRAQDGRAESGTYVPAGIDGRLSEVQSRRELPRKRSRGLHHGT